MARLSTTPTCASSWWAPTIVLGIILLLASPTFALGANSQEDLSQRLEISLDAGTAPRVRALFAFSGVPKPVPEFALILRGGPLASGPTCRVRSGALAPQAEQGWVRAPCDLSDGPGDARTLRLSLPEDIDTARHGDPGVVLEIRLAAGPTLIQDPSDPLRLSLPVPTLVISDRHRALALDVALLSSLDATVEAIVPQQLRRVADSDSGEGPMRLSARLPASLRFVSLELRPRGGLPGFGQIVETAVGLLAAVALTVLVVIALRGRK